MKNSLHGGSRRLCKKSEKGLEEYVSVKDISLNIDRDEKMEEYIKMPK